MVTPLVASALLSSGSKPWKLAVTSIAFGGVFLILLLSSFTAILRDVESSEKSLPRPSSMSLLAAGYKKSAHSFELDHMDSTNTRREEEFTSTSIFDFAIVGFPKTATTFLHKYFNSKVPQIYMPRGELCAFTNETTHHDLISRFYDPSELCEKDNKCGISDTKQSLDQFKKLYRRRNKEVRDAKLIGFKCPRVLETQDTYPSSIPYFSKTNFIVQIRHPVLWFESYYNYRSEERYPEKLLSPDELVGACDDKNKPYIVRAGLKHVRNVCTDRSKFHVSLARLGLTSMNSSEEMHLLEGAPMSVHPSNGEVFLFEVGQLGLDNQTRTDTFRKDLQKFLGLKKELPPFSKHIKNPSTSRKASKINICDDEHAKVRAALIENGRNAAKWIRDHFLKSRKVHVTSKDFFLELLDRWDEDPCKTRGTQHM